MRFRGTVYRAHNPQWAWTPLSGEGAQGVTAGASTSAAPPRSTVPFPRLGRYGRQRHWADRCSPSRCAPVRSIPRPCSMLATRRKLQESGFGEADPACPTWEADMLGGRVAASQRLAERLVDAGYVGMLVRSFAVDASEDDVNLVMWHWGDVYPTRVTVIDEPGSSCAPISDAVLAFVHATYNAAFGRHAVRRRCSHFAPHVVSRDHADTSMGTAPTNAKRQPGYGSPAGIVLRVTPHSACCQTALRRGFRVRLANLRRPWPPPSGPRARRLPPGDYERLARSHRAPCAGCGARSWRNSP